MSESTTEQHPAGPHGRESPPAAGEDSASAPSEWQSPDPTDQVPDSNPAGPEGEQGTEPQPGAGQPGAESPADDSATAEPPAAEPPTESSAESPTAPSPAAESSAESPAAPSPAVESSAESPAAPSPAAESPADDSPIAESAAAEVVDPAERGFPYPEPYDTPDADDDTPDADADADSDVPVSGEALLVQEGEIAGDYLEQLLDILDYDGDIDLDVEGSRAIVAVVGANDLDPLVGTRGVTLDALQELTRLAVAQQTGVRTRLMLDIGGYRAGRRAELSALAATSVTRVIETGETVRMSAMNAFERKIVHDVVTATDGVRSESEGEDPDRRVVILPDR